MEVDKVADEVANMVVDMEVDKVADEVADMVMDIKIDRPRQTRTDQRYLAYLEKG